MKSVRDNIRRAHEPLFIRVSQSRETIGVSRSTVYRWEKRGLIKIYRIGGVSLLRAADVIALMQKADGERNAG